MPRFFRLAVVDAERWDRSDLCAARIVTLVGSAFTWNPATGTAMLLTDDGATQRWAAVEPGAWVVKGAQPGQVAVVDDDRFQKSGYLPERLVLDACRHATGDTITTGPVETL